MLKSIWFWFLVVWLLAVGVGVAVFLHLGLMPSWGWWVIGALVAAGLAVTWILRQRALIRDLARGREDVSRDAFEDAWKAGARSDFGQLLVAGAGAVQIGMRTRSDLSKNRVVWVLSDRPDVAIKELEKSGARDLCAAREHELSGEFSRIAAWLSHGNQIFLVARSLPDPRKAASIDGIRFVLEELQSAGRSRGVDRVLVVLDVDSGESAERIRIGVAYLAEQSGVEFPLHVLVRTSGSHAGELARVAGSLPGTRLPWKPQEVLPQALDEAWERLVDGLVLKTPGLLARSGKFGLEPRSVLLSMQALEREGSRIRKCVLSVAGGMAQATRPFLRGVYLCTRDEAAASGLGNDGAESASKGIAALLAEEPDLARLGTRRQVTASVFASAFLVVSVLLSAGLVAWAMHGSWTASGLRRDWNAKLDAAKSAPWGDGASMAASLFRLAALDSLVEEIDDGRPWYLAPGFYPDGQYLGEAEGELDRRLRALTAGAFQTIELDLRARTSSLQGGMESDAGDLYRDLRNYLLTSKDGWRQAKSDEGDEALASALADSWTVHMRLQQPVGARERETLRHLSDRVAESVGDGDESWLGQTDPGLVAAARQLLRDAHDQTGAFARVIAAADSLPSLDGDSLGLDPKILGCPDVSIPSAYTRRGWIEGVEPLLAELADGKPDWVLGASAEDATGATAQSLAELRRRYADAFVAAWTAAFDSSACRLPVDNQRAAAALEYLVSPYDRKEPRGIVAFLSRYLEETNLLPAPAQGGGGVPLPKGVQGKVANASKVADMVQSRLAPGEKGVPELVAEQLAPRSEWAREALKGGLDALSNDLRQLAGILGRQASDAEGLTFVAEVVREDPRNPLVHAIGEASSLRDRMPPGLRGWWDAHTRAILRELTSGMTPKALAAADKEYRENIWQPWQNLTKRNFPFDPYAETEASIDDIDRLINPQTGAVALFLKTHEGLLRVEGDEIVSRTGGGVSTTLDPVTVKGVKRILRMGAFFYGKGGGSWKGLATSVSVRADSRSKVVLSVGSQSIEAAWGVERRLSIRWPQKGASGIAMQVTTNTSGFDERRDGEWALLRLFDAGGSERTLSYSDKSYIVDVPLSVRIDQPGGPFLERDFFKVDLAPSLFR